MRTRGLSKYSIADRYRILEQIAREANRRYKQNLRNMDYGHGAKGTIHHALKWNIDPVQGHIEFYLDAGSPHMNKVLHGLEYGTGVYGPDGAPLKAKTGKFLRFKKTSSYKPRRHSAHKLPSDQQAFESNGYIFTKYSRGTKPGYMMTKAVKSVHQRWGSLVKLNAMKLGIEHG